MSDGKAPRVVVRNRHRELWIGEDRQGTYDPRRPGACGRGWYWPLMARLCALYLRERSRAGSRAGGRGSRAASPEHRASNIEHRATALFLGLGAATVPRLLAHRYPGLPMTAVERDARVIALCRKHFDPPRGLRITRGDAAAFARGRGDRFAIIVEDVFSAATQGRFDRAAGLDADYFRTLWRNRLAPGGLLLINLFSGPDYTRGRIVLRAALASFATPRRFSPRHGANEVWALLKPATVSDRRR